MRLHWTHALAIVALVLISAWLVRVLYGMQP
jgi:cytochrome b561